MGNGVDDKNGTSCVTAEQAAVLMQDDLIGAPGLQYQLYIVYVLALGA